MRYILVFLAFFCSFASAMTLDELQATLTKNEVVRADFVQERQIKNIKTPLISKGKMLLSQDKGLWWQQTEPFKTTLILRENEMIQRMDGQEDQRITLENNPQMFQFNSLMRALVKADKAVLDNHFALEFSDKGQNQWELVLVPTTTPLDKIFSRIELSGSTVVDNVILIDKQGDSTKITFTNHLLTPSTLTPEETQYFD
ncbi:TPA: outer membrane lipoprotein carrier protein LolA [Providencia alcalifaciens]